MRLAIEVPMIIRLTPYFRWTSADCIDTIPLHGALESCECFLDLLVLVGLPLANDLFTHTFDVVRLCFITCLNQDI